MKRPTKHERLLARLVNAAWRVAGEFDGAAWNDGRRYENPKLGPQSTVFNDRAVMHNFQRTAARVLREAARTKP
jgi:hypothetical protein